MTIFKEIYNSFFAKDYGTVWKKFAKENNGAYLPISDDRVQFVYKDFLLTFDAYTHYSVVGGSSYEHHYTRGFVEFICPNNFNLRITEQGFFENIGKLFGSQDIQIGDEDFDDTFMVKSNDEPKAMLFLSNNSITKVLQDLKTVRLDISNGEGLWGEHPKEGNFMIYFVLDEKIIHIEQLNKLYRLFAESINMLKQLGSIKPVVTNL